MVVTTKDTQTTLNNHLQSPPWLYNIKNMALFGFFLVVFKIRYKEEFFKKRIHRNCYEMHHCIH